MTEETASGLEREAEFRRDRVWQILEELRSRLTPGEFLDQAMGVATAVTLVSYALYSQEAAVFVKGRELAGMPFVAFGLLYYLRLAHVDAVRVGPVEMAWSSRPLQLCALGWLVATSWSLGAF